jgi:hypothetical protein
MRIDAATQGESRRVAAGRRGPLRLHCRGGYKWLPSPRAAPATETLTSPPTSCGRTSPPATQPRCDRGIHPGPGTRICTVPVCLQLRSLGLALSDASTQRLTGAALSRIMAAWLGDDESTSLKESLMHTFPCTRHSKKASPGTGRGL